MNARVNRRLGAHIAQQRQAIHGDLSAFGITKGGCGGLHDPPVIGAVVHETCAAVMLRAWSDRRARLSGRMLREGRIVFERTGLRTPCFRGKPLRNPVSNHMQDGFR